MESKSSSPHFEGKPISEHLKEARLRGHLAARESHGTEMPGFFAACAHGAKDTACLLMLLWTLLFVLPLPLAAPWRIYALFIAGWLVWKVGRSCLLGWSRLERMHRVIDEERREIELNRSAEREELAEIYKAKGFSGKLLDDVVDVLMADDNRLLRVMLEEELGLSLESESHPVQQGLGAGCGVLTIGALALACNHLYAPLGLPLICSFTLFLSAHLCAKMESNRPAPLAIWHLCLAGASIGVVFFLAKIL